MDSLLLKQTLPPSSVVHGARCVTTLHRNSRRCQHSHDRLKRRRTMAKQPTQLTPIAHEGAADILIAQTRIFNALRDKNATKTRHQQVDQIEK